MGRCPTLSSFSGSTIHYPYSSQYKEYLLHKYTYDRRRSLLSLLLDSSLITATQNVKYSIKVIKCGDYFQVYRFNKTKIKKSKNMEFIKNYIGKEYVYTDMLIKTQNYKPMPSREVIEEKNILRSKFSMQRLIKSNEKYFKTFITLTFADNITDIKIANKKFHSWRTKIQSIYKDFRYIAVPEFQKRGAVHYHLLTNLEIDKIYHYSRRNKQTEVKLIIYQNGENTKFDVKYWPHGFTSVFNVTDINVVGYMSKYMTKDIDNRLFSHRRYFYSSNLIRPYERYIDLSNDNDFIFFADLMSHTQEKFSKTYLDIFGDNVYFTEYKFKGNCEYFPREAISDNKSDNIYYVNLYIY